MQDKYSVNMDIHLSRLDELGRKAEEEKHFSASINAEQLRGKVGGLYDPTIRLESAVENLPREELIKQLSELQKKNINIVGEENIIEHFLMRINAYFFLSIECVFSTESLFSNLFGSIFTMRRKSLIKLLT